MNKWLVTLFATLLLVSPLQAETYTWIGQAGTGNWTYLNNWTGGSSYPKDGDTANIYFGDVQAVAPNPNFATEANDYIYNGNINLFGGKMEINGAPDLTSFAVGIGNQANITQTGGIVIFESNKPDRSLYIGGHPAIESNTTTVAIYDQQAGIFENNTRRNHLYVGAHGAKGIWTIGRTATASSQDLFLGYTGRGELTINGGSLSVEKDIEVGTNNYGSGDLLLNRGTIEARTMIVGNSEGRGWFTMKGGRVDLECLEISRNGTGYVDIWGGELDISWAMGATRVPGNSQGSGALSIYGSKSKITMLDFNTQFNDLDKGTLSANFTLDRYGVTTIEAGRYADTNLPMAILPSGFFMTLDVDYIDLISAPTLAALDNFATATAYNNTGFEFNKTQGDKNGASLRYVIDNDPDKMETWDLLGEFRFEDGPKERGYIKVDGNATELLVIWENPAHSYSQTLLDYLNNSLLETGAKFFMDGCGRITMSAGYLNDDGYAYFGWNFESLNSETGAGYAILGFQEVPEPATWLLLLAGITLGVIVRKKSHKAKFSGQ